MAGFRSGFVAVLGLPNAGKSTLVNCFFEKSPCIVSYKPQTTRFHVRCISTTAERQIVFVDTPGWHTRGQTLGKFMRREITRSLSGADVMLYLVDATHPVSDRNRYALGILRQGVTAPLVIALNKIDRLDRSNLAMLLDELYRGFQPREIVPISALEKRNVDELDAVLSGLLPEGPQLYPDEVVVDKPDEFLFAEFIREQLYLTTKEEVPFSCAVDLESVERQGERVAVRAAILVAKQSQKGILIGEGGTMIARIRGMATRRIRQFAGQPAELELTVKVRPKWFADERFLDKLAFNS